MVEYDEILAEIEREEKEDSAAEYLEKTKRIKKEVARLKRLFKKIDENKKKLVFATIDDVADIPSGSVKRKPRKSLFYKVVRDFYVH